jgi:hypothetical protein
MALVLNNRRDVVAPAFDVEDTYVFEFFGFRIIDVQPV